MGARDNTLQPDAYQGANITLTNPGGIGTVASVPRLMPGQGTIVATGAIGYPPGLTTVDPARLAELGVQKVMTMTSTYDHRVIQGAESGAFLRRIDQLLQGEDGFYETVFEAHRRAARPRRRRPTPATAAEPVPAAAAPAAPAVADDSLLQAVQAATSLVKAHRMHGHLAARLDPLGSEPVGDPALEPATVGLNEELMRRIPASVLRVAVPGETFADALPNLRRTYTGTIAYEIEHISDHEQRVWLRQAIESGTYRQPLEPEERRRLLERLSEVEALENYLHKAFLGKKQFSIEGLDAVVPMLDETIELAAGAGAREVVLGMAHRGRLNVLAHTVGRPYASILAEFEGEQTIAVETAAPEGGTGDVKYHYGASGTYPTHAGAQRDRHAVAEPEPPRVRQPGDRGPRARRPDHAQGARAGARPRRRGAGADPRRRGLPRPGHRLRDAQPPGAAGLLDRRHDPPDRQQPARLHDRPAREPLHALRLGPRQGLRHADHPRERRRRGGVRRRLAARARLPRDVRPRRADRPDRLPPLRPQRDGRAGLHAAADVRADQEPPARAQAATPTSWSPTAWSRRRRPTAMAERGLPAGRRGARGAEGVDRRARRTPARTSSTAR